VAETLLARADVVIEQQSVDDRSWQFFGAGEYRE